jgi:hypothetical protein
MYREGHRGISRVVPEQRAPPLPFDSNSHELMLLSYVPLACRLPGIVASGLSIIVRFNMLLG